jgi:hypothetical protein
MAQIFTMVIVDEDVHTFDVQSMFDDRPLDDKVVKAQEAKRNVRCFSTESTLRQIEQEFSARGYRPSRVVL